ncbi:MAG: hypothetical protein ABJB61_07890, partial [bacterium]
RRKWCALHLQITEATSPPLLTAEFVFAEGVCAGADAFFFALRANKSDVSNNLPIKLALISPTGSVLQVADSANGVAVISAPVTQSGTYVVKTINLSVGPVQVWTATTPTVKR